MNISSDNLRDIGLYLPLEDLFHLAITDKRCYRELFEYDHFWSLYSQDRDRPDNTTWREHYRRMKFTWFSMVSTELQVELKLSVRQIVLGSRLVVVVTQCGELWISSKYRQNLGTLTRVVGIGHLDVVRAHCITGDRIIGECIIVLTGDGGLYRVDLSGPITTAKLLTAPIVKDSVMSSSGTVYHHDTDGTLWRGYGRRFQIFTDKKIVKVVWHIDHMIVLDSDGTLWSIERSDLVSSHPTSEPDIYRVDIGLRVKDFDCATHVMAVIDTDLQLWMCGDNRDGRLGLKDAEIITTGFIHVLSGVKRVCCTYHSTIVILDDNTVCYTGFDHFSDRSMIYGFMRIHDRRWSDIICSDDGSLVICRTYV